MELFAADGHDAGGCERVTGKSGMRPIPVGVPVVSCHTFRATGITAYLSNGGTLEHAQQIAATRVAQDDEAVQPDGGTGRGRARPGWHARRSRCRRRRRAGAGRNRVDSRRPLDAKSLRPGRSILHVWSDSGPAALIRGKFPRKSGSHS